MKIRKQNNLVTRRTFASDQRPSCGLVERIVRHFFIGGLGSKSLHSNLFYQHAASLNLSPG